MASLDEKALRLPKKASKVKNKAPAPVQITAEQLLREAKERDLEILPPPPKQKISDPEELKEYQLKRRKEFEDNIRKNRGNVPNWIKYAKWEESQGELQRARSIFERALDVDHRNISIWLQYAEMEMRNRQVNHARNIWDRAVSLLPRANQFWLKYSFMEEMIENIPGARQVFERWMEWEPNEQAWQTYINFELRYHEIERARAIWLRFLHVHPDAKNWIRYARFEERHGFITNARKVYERAVEFFGEEHMDESLFIAFARFEESQKEHERARLVYRFALDHLPKNCTEQIYKYYTIHEKKYGERTDIESVIVSKRRRRYEDQVVADPLNYDAWFDLLKLLESEQSDCEVVRDAYERAIANVPPEQTKMYWRRYVYLWINYAVYEELDANNVENAREVYRMCLELIPHKKFTFAKIWLLFAHFEIRQKNLDVARKILGTAIGKCPKDKLFKGYIDLELQLREFDRCRILYGKFLDFAPENCATWIKFAEMESLLGDTDRARGVYELAVSQPALDMPEVLWKSYIDFETQQEEYEKARRLYRLLLDRTNHVKVWISLAKFEQSVNPEDPEAATAVYRNANKALRPCEEKEQRLMLLEAWKQFETTCGNVETLREVENEMPKRVKKRRQIFQDNGMEAGWEEYYDYIFPSDESSQWSLKLLSMAKQWKQQQAEPPASADQSLSVDQQNEARTTSGKIKEESPEEKVREGDSDTDIEDNSD